MLRFEVPQRENTSLQPNLDMLCISKAKSKREPSFQCKNMRRIQYPHWHLFESSTWKCTSCKGCGHMDRGTSWLRARCSMKWKLGVVRQMGEAHYRTMVFSWSSSLSDRTMSIPLGMMNSGRGKLSRLPTLRCERLRLRQNLTTTTIR